MTNQEPTNQVSGWHGDINTNGALRVAYFRATLSDDIDLENTKSVNRRLGLLKSLAIKGPMSPSKLQNEVVDYEKLRLAHATVAGLVKEMINNGEAKRVREREFKNTGITQYDLEITDKGLRHLVYYHRPGLCSDQTEFTQFMEKTAQMFPFYRAVLDMKKKQWGSLAAVVLERFDYYPMDEGELLFFVHDLAYGADLSRQAGLNTWDPKCDVLRTSELADEAKRYLVSRPELGPLLKRAIDSLVSSKVGAMKASQKMRDRIYNDFS
jgi:hypothetical protein